MNKENASKLWKIIQEAGDYLQGQLPDHPNHPKGRNPYAHVAICIKNNILLYKKDTIYSKPIAKLEAGRLVLIKKCKIKWCKIKTENFGGWVLKSSLWGKVK